MSISAPVRTDHLKTTTTLVSVYVVVTAVTLVALAAMGAVGSAAATQPAWVHAVIVAGFAVLLPLRLRAARQDRPGALRAVRIIAAVLLVVNLVEALALPLFPTWMRVEMIGVAVLMAGVVASTLRRRA